MRRAGLALCVAASLGVGAFATASASAAAPEFGRCIKQVAVEKIYHGKYLDSKCTKAVTVEEEAKKGKYEWSPGPGPSAGFTVTTGTAVLETTSGKLVVCNAGSGAGQLLAGTNKEQSLTITFTGCTADFKCSTGGKGTGEVTTNPLIGEAGWQEKAKRKTALELRAAPGNEGIIATLQCVGLEIQLRGAVLVPIKNDKMTVVETLNYKSTHGSQKPTVWRTGEAGEESVFLEASFEKAPYQQAGLTTEAAVQGEEATELNAIV